MQYCYGLSNISAKVKFVMKIGLKRLMLHKAFWNITNKKNFHFLVEKMQFQNVHILSFSYIHANDSVQNFIIAYSKNFVSIFTTRILNHIHKRGQ